MQVDNVSGAADVLAKYGVQKTTAKATNALDSSQFMQILLTQLTHQNPLEPMDNNEMLNQFSALNSLQELRDIHTSMDKVSVSNQTAYLASLIGKKVKVNRPEGQTLEGIVDGVITQKDKPQLLIGNETVDLSDVLEVKGEVK